MLRVLFWSFQSVWLIWFRLWR